MRRILVATDFSIRSDRAVRRGTLLAKALEASLSLVHVIDDDQPRRIVKAERAAATALLDEQARTLRRIDGVDCDTRIVLGHPFEGITTAAEEIAPDLLVIGPHRKQALKDEFVGTTAERTIRASRRPVLMANGVPAGIHRHVLIAVDLSACSRAALRAVTDLGLEKHAAISVIHVFEAPGTSLMARGSMTKDQIEDYLADEEEEAASALAAFLGDLEFEPIRRILKHNEGSAAHTICAAARENSADLLVVGTRGRTGIGRFLLGSVAEAVLRAADHDVLAVPPALAVDSVQASAG